MARRAKEYPTDAEFEILNVLWENGPSTVREIQEELNELRPTGYKTVLKLAQIMHEKGYVERDESSRAHIYSAAVEERAVKKRVMESLLDKIFKGSSLDMFASALMSGNPSREELEEIREMIREQEKRDGE